MALVAFVPVVAFLDGICGRTGAIESEKMVGDLIIRKGYLRISTYEWASMPAEYQTYMIMESVFVKEDMVLLFCGCVSSQLSATFTQK